MMIKSGRAVQPFRKYLGRRVRNGTATLRVFGSRGAWHLGIQVGNTIYRFNDPMVPYVTMVTAIMAGYRKYNRKASQYKMKSCNAA